jgi:KUP system potassium uptake protein
MRAPQSHGHASTPLAQMALAALGVVYGDIGTSPLYALRECFHGDRIAVNSANVLGILSLILWVLILCIGVKYMVFVLRADNRGEGGILALTALACPARLRNRKWLLFGLGIFGAALLYGDGIITPAISVLSAVEGLKLATDGLTPFVVPITVAILVVLFLQQRHGTGKIGAVFGPIVVCWFVTLGALGVHGILMNPGVLAAINPAYALSFFIENQMEGFFVLGSVFLVVTGGEALYADMGHFGRRPIRLAWWTLVMPGLVLNYFGQGALMLTKPETAMNPFYLLAPSWALYPLIALSTMTTVIASQALISGVFSITKQAIQMGLWPRLQIIHTSSREIGQIYLPQVNAALLIGTVWLVLQFQSSSNLAAAYGISVSGAMVVTTLLMYIVARRQWGWTTWVAVLVCGPLFLMDLAFFGANIIKVHQGGWVPLVIGLAMLFLMLTWREGRKILADRMRKSQPPLAAFWQDAEERLARKTGIDCAVRVPGVAVFMVGDRETTPPALVHNVKHNKVLHDKIIILTIVSEEVPVVRENEWLEIEKAADRVYRVVAHYGFMETPDVQEIMERIRETGIQFEPRDVTYFVGRETLIASENPGMAIWREQVFAFMARNAFRATMFYNIPADQVIEVGMQVEL